MPTMTIPNKPDRIYFSYIERNYNTKRIHSTPGWIRHTRFETQNS